LIRKHFLQTAAAALTAAALTAAFTGSLPVSAARQYEACISNVKVYDVQGVFDAETLEIASLAVQKTSETIDMYVAVYICGSETKFSSDSAVAAYADDAYDALFNPQYDVDTDGVLLLINNSTNYDYLSTSGMGQLYYYNGSDDDRTWQILEDITPALKNEDYLSAIYTFCTDLEKYYNAGIPDNSYSYDAEKETYYYNSGGSLVEANSLPWWFGTNFRFLIPLGLIIGAIAAAIAAFCIKNSYQLKKSLSPINYVSQQETNFYVKDDLFLRRHVSKTYISSDSGGRSGGGGGGHSHSSSGGHSHGGGGHHR